MPVSRRDFLGSLASASLALPALAAKKPAPERPNLVLLVVDDLPAWMVGCYGNQEVKTPNIDKLSTTGTRFQNHFTAAPEPSLGRAVILTGQTPQNAANAATLDKILGGEYQSEATPAGSASEVSAAANQFIDKQSAGKPFFLTATFSDVKPPYSGVPAQFESMYTAATFANYDAGPASTHAAAGKELMRDVHGNLAKAAAAISFVDEQIGAIVAKLYQKQFIDNTIVLLTASCGSSYGRHGLWGAGDASEPPNVFDDAIQVPAIWSWAHRFPPMGVQVEMVSTYDLAPTICELLSIPAPSGLPGRSYLVLAEGKKPPKKEPWRTSVCGHLGDTDYGREEHYKVVLRNGKAPNELFDISRDPQEKTNEYQNGEYADVRSRLENEIARWKNPGAAVDQTKSKKSKPARKR
ncbi:MAG TPA: sulfatase-like hydrolase/transferase [Candidatus Limnocylindrales bacterium]|nr:sulfatase-like hydrolase/transferase [Candidatus Limnocylindrales bacterium]